MPASAACSSERLTDCPDFALCSRLGGGSQVGILIPDQITNSANPPYPWELQCLTRGSLIRKGDLDSESAPIPSCPNSDPVRRRRLPSRSFSLTHSVSCAWPTLMELTADEEGERGRGREGGKRIGAKPSSFLGRRSAFFLSGGAGELGRWFGESRFEA